MLKRPITPIWSGFSAGKAIGSTSTSFAKSLGPSHDSSTLTSTPAPKTGIQYFFFYIQDPFKRETRHLIVEVLELTAEEHLNLYKLRESLKYADLKDLFLILDVYNKGYLDSDSLLTVFKTNQIYCDDKGLKCLMKMFRKRVDERISFNEFVAFVTLS